MSRSMRRAERRMTSAIERTVSAGAPPATMPSRYAPTLIAESGVLRSWETTARICSRARASRWDVSSSLAFSIASAARRASSVAIPTARWSKRRPEDVIPNASAPMIPVALRSGTPR